MKKSLKRLKEIYEEKCSQQGQPFYEWYFNDEVNYIELFAEAINEYIKPLKHLVIKWDKSDSFELKGNILVLKYYKSGTSGCEEYDKVTIELNNNKAKKAYSSKSAAKRAMKSKAHYIDEKGTSGTIMFGRIWYEDNVLYAESAYWTESTLQDFLNDKRKLYE